MFYAAAAAAAGWSRRRLVTKPGGAPWQANTHVLASGFHIYCSGTSDPIAVVGGGFGGGGGAGPVGPYRKSPAPDFCG